MPVIQLLARTSGRTAQSSRQASRTQVRGSDSQVKMQASYRKLSTMCSDCSPGILFNFAWYSLFILVTDLLHTNSRCQM